MIANKQFDRKAVVTVGSTTTGGTAIKNLRCRFRIEKTKDSSANAATVEVYNLSEKSRTLFVKDNILKVEAGYGENLKVIFIGDITKVNHVKEPLDRITKAECGDGQNDLTTARISKSFPKGTPLFSVVSDLVASFPNLTNKIPPLISPTKQMVTGGTYDGNTKDILDQILPGLGFEWSVQDGEIQIVATGTAAISQPVLLTSNTGLIGSPSKTEEGVDFSCLLNPLILPGNIIVLQSAEVTGNYIVDKVIHAGDTDRGDWLSTIEGKPV